MRTQPLPEFKEYFSIWETGRPTGCWISVLEVSNMREASACDYSGIRATSFLPALRHQAKVWDDTICWDDWEIQCRRPEHIFAPCLEKWTPNGSVWGSRADGSLTQGLRTPLGPLLPGLRLSKIQSRCKPARNAPRHQFSPSSQCLQSVCVT